MPLISPSSPRPGRYLLALPRVWPWLPGVRPRGPQCPCPRAHLHRTVEAGLRHGGGPLSALDYSGSKNSADGKVFWNPEGTELADPFLKGQTGLTRFSAPVGSVSSAAVVTAPSVSEPSSSRHPHLPWQGGGREGRPGLAPVQVRPHLLQEEPWEGRAVS